MSAQEMRKVHEAANKPQLGIDERLKRAMEGRHPGTQSILRWFDYGHLPQGRPRLVSCHITGVAVELAETLGDGPELTAGLRKLMEAKDCFVRQAILDNEVHG